MMTVVNGWICESHNEHNCAGGTAESGYHHESYCGLEPIVEVPPMKARVVIMSESPGDSMWFWFLPNPLAGEVAWIDFGYADTHAEAIAKARNSVELHSALFKAWTDLAVQSFDAYTTPRNNK